MARHRFSQNNDDLRWSQSLAAASVDEVRRRWSQADHHTPGWKLIALARRMIALGQPVVLSARLVASLEQRQRHGEPAHTWAALPNLRRMASTSTGGQHAAHGDGERDPTAGAGCRRASI